MGERNREIGICRGIFSNGAAFVAPFLSFFGGFVIAMPARTNGAGEGNDFVNSPPCHGTAVWVPGCFDSPHAPSFKCPKVGVTCDSLGSK